MPSATFYQNQVANDQRILADYEVKLSNPSLSPIMRANYEKGYNSYKAKLASDQALLSQALATGSAPPPSPTPDRPPVVGGKSNALWWILGGLAVVVLLTSFKKLDTE